MDNILIHLDDNNHGHTAYAVSVNQLYDLIESTTYQTLVYSSVKLIT